MLLLEAVSRTVTSLAESVRVCVCVWGGGGGAFLGKCMSNLEISHITRLFSAVDSIFLVYLESIITYF